MDRAHNCGGLDRFRIFAAVLVVAIHTSPLLCIGAEADFFLTRVLARVAVPFFLAVTGQFTVSASATSEEPGKHLLRYLRKTLLLYGIAILIYLPIGFYAGHYRGLGLLEWLRLLFFDGTFYHLWYFPACLIGVPLTVWMARKLKPMPMLAVCGVLWLIGLFGDSYYGVAEQIPLLRNAYGALFSVVSYTRNGIFYAPVFLTLGYLAGKKQPMRRLPAMLGLLFSLAAMTAEAFALRHFQLPRHDSMYVALVPAVWFLYQLLIAVPAKPMPILRSISAWVYILHPAVIVAVRAVAKLTGWQSLMVEQSAVHFLLVCVGSFALAWGLSFLGGKKRELPLSRGRAWIELDREALEHNVRCLQKRLPEGCLLMPAVKANAYGHGAVLLAKELNRLGIFSFCVACVQEGIELRRAGVRGEILILGYTSPGQFRLLRRYRLAQTVLDYDYARELNRYGKKLRVHIGVDTGMHRLGERFDGASDEFARICEIAEMKNLSVEGLCTHLATADGGGDAEDRLLYRQVNSFRLLAELLRRRGLCFNTHMLASYGVLRFPEIAGDRARVGIALYGTLSTSADTADLGSALRPVLSLKARVETVKTLYAGESAGYGAAFTAERDRKIAVLAIGYADGLPTALSCGKGSVLIRGVRAPVIGRICMDQTIVDVSAVPEISAGDIAVLIGRSGELSVSACDWAELAHTSANEILSRLGARLERGWREATPDAAKAQKQRFGRVSAYRNYVLRGEKQRS